MRIYNRKTKEYKDINQYKQNYLLFLYNKPVGRLLLKIIINPMFSKINGLYNSSKLSTKKIPKFIEDNNINLGEYEKANYKSFNDFFTRKIKKGKRPIDKNNKSLISPADSKLLVYNISNDLKLNIKDSIYSLNELVADKIDLKDFKNGYCLVFRLSVDDYHRYCYIDDGEELSNYDIKGKLHTVSSISKEYKIYKENSRVINHLKTNNFDEIIQIEVGALLVGKIINKNKPKFNKGEEKGYFKLGGSTIVVLLKDNVVKIDKDILEQSKNDIETIVKYGERIGRKL